MTLIHNIMSCCKWINVDCVVSIGIEKYIPNSNVALKIKKPQLKQVPKRLTPKHVLFTYKAATL